jgi:hypothetical protein
MSNANHGVSETAPIDDQLREFMERAKANATVDWTDARLKRVVRLRLLGDRGYPWWDVSYCYGELHDGTPVPVQLPFSQLPRRGTRSAIVRYAMADKVHAKDLGVFDAISTLL